MQMYRVWNRDLDRTEMIAPLKVISSYYRFHKEAEERMKRGAGDFFPKNPDGTRAALHIEPVENVTYDRVEASLPGV